MPLIKRLLCYLMGTLYIAAGINHFWHPAFYLHLMPDWMPWHEMLVQLSGVAEILLGLMLFFPRTRHLGAWGIIAMLVVFLIVHIDMIRNSERYPTVSSWFLWIRLVLQGLLILWAYWYTKPDVTSPSVKPLSTTT